MEKTSDGRQRIEKFFCNAFNTLAIIMFALLLWYSLHLTGQNGRDNEYISFRQDSVIYNIFSVCVSLLCLFFFGKIAEKMRGRKTRNIALAIVCVLTAGISFYWVSVCKVAPEADQMMISQYADAFNMGDFNGILKGRYIARYPQQLGMVTLLKFIFSIFGPYNYKAFQYLVAAVVPLIVLSGCKIVRLLSDDNVKAEIFYLLFTLTCFPMYIYTSFVYGDIISPALGLFGVWMYLAYLKKFSWIRLLLFGISMGVAVQLRANLLILVIAMAIVLLIKLIVDWKWQNIVIAIALALGVVLTYMAVWGLYSDKMEEKAPSIPPLLFIVMGLNDAGGRPGWYNAYNYIVFAEAYDNTELSISIGKEHLMEALQRYWEDPDYMLNFFQRKMNAQWNAPMYQCIAMNRNIAEPQIGKLAPDITNYGRTAQLMESWMKIYQLLLYGGTLFLLTVKRKEFVRIEKYALLVAVYGGFLFSLIWEAKTRYVLPFLFFQIPYMALGVSELVAVPQKLSGLRGVEAGGDPLCVQLLQKAWTGIRTAVGKVWRTFRENRYFVGICATILIAHMLLVLFYGVQKKGFHEEEYCTYYTSTGGTYISPSSPVSEESGYSIQHQFLVADVDRFHYDVVEDAQKKAVHPPLYYLTLHTLMSLRPNSFYKWFGIGLNAICSLVSCCGIILLVLKLDKSRYRRTLAGIAGLTYAVCPVVISGIMFTGAYIMNAMWAVLYLNLFVTLVRNLRCAKWKFIGLAAAGGVMCGLWFLTSYFSLVLILFLALGGCLWGAARCQGLGRMLRWTGVMVVSAGMAVLVYPFSVRHILLFSSHVSGNILYSLGTVLIPAAVYLVCRVGLWAWERRFSLKKYWSVPVVAAVLVCSGAGMALGGVQFLYRSQGANVAFARDNAQYPAVVVYGYASQEQAWYASSELWPYDCVVYVDYMDGENALVNETLQTAEKLIVYMDCSEDMLEHIIARNDNLSSYCLVRQDELFSVYEVE